MTTITLNETESIKVNLKAQESTLNASLKDINYIPSYKEAETERRTNELERIAYYEEIQQKVANGEFNGEKGDKGEAGELKKYSILNTELPFYYFGDDTNFTNTITYNNTTYKIGDSLVMFLEDLNPSILSYEEIIFRLNLDSIKTLINLVINGLSDGFSYFFFCGWQVKLNNEENEKNIELIYPNVISCRYKKGETLAEFSLIQGSNSIAEESDPTVPDCVKNITEENIANWNNKSEFSGSYDDLTNKPIIPSEYTLPTASSDTLGGVKIGDGLSITDGVLSAAGGSSGTNDYNQLLNKPILYVNGVEDYYIEDPPLLYDLEPGVYIANGYFKIPKGTNGAVLEFNNDLILVEHWGNEVYVLKFTLYYGVFTLYVVSETDYTINRFNFSDYYTKTETETYVADVIASQIGNINTELATLTTVSEV